MSETQDLEPECHRSQDNQTTEENWSIATLVEKKTPALQNVESEKSKNVGLEYADQVQIETVNLYDSLDALKMPDDADDDVFQSTQNDFFCGSQNAESNVFTSTQISVDPNIDDNILTSTQIGAGDDQPDNQVYYYPSYYDD